MKLYARQTLIRVEVVILPIGLEMNYPGEKKRREEKGSKARRRMKGFKGRSWK
jgi:hypothetical protein